MKIFILLPLLLISIVSTAATKQRELDGIKLGTRVDSLGITLDEYKSIYTYKEQYVLWAIFREKGHPIFAIEKLCKESGNTASLDGIGCNQSYKELKTAMDGKINPICEGEGYDEYQTPYAYYDQSTNHFWIIDEKNKIFSVGIASGADSIPRAEGNSQICKPLSKETLLKKQKELKEEADREAKRKSEEKAKQAAKEKMQKESVANLLAKRKTPWISWTNYGYTLREGYYNSIRTDYYYDPKSISKTKDGLLILIRKDTTDYDSVAVSLIELNCNKETYREFQEFTFDTPIQAVKLKKIGPYDGVWNYIDPNLIHAELYKKVCG